MRGHSQKQVDEKDGVQRHGLQAFVFDSSDWTNQIWGGERIIGDYTKLQTELPAVLNALNGRTLVPLSCL